MPDHKVRLLLIQANPPGTVMLDTDLEERNLQAALRRGQQRDHFAQPARLPAARNSDLLTELRAQQPHILHFMGHGDGTGGLLLNAPDDSRGAPLTVAQLAELLRIYQAEAAAPLQLVVLAGCYTASAAVLLAAQVACVVAVAGDIEDAAVREAFTPTFYATLSDGRSVANAVVSAQAVMNAMGFTTAAALIQLHPRPGLDPATLRPLEWCTPAPSPAPAFSPLHLEYLRFWFGQPWTTVSLADLQRERQDQASLLDLYVPLPVDCEFILKIAEQQIVDWWVVQPDLHDAPAEQPAGKLPASRNAPVDETDLSPEQRNKVRQWADLRVGEAELQKIVDDMQRKLSVAIAAGEKVEDGELPYYMEAHDAASVQPRFVLLGDPGSGKSSFLRHLALCLAGELRRRAGDTATPANAGLPALRDWLLDAYTPIYLEMRTLVGTSFPPLPADPQQTPPAPPVHLLWTFVRDHLLGPGLATFESELRTLAGAGKVILLLDGLDEIPQADDPRRRTQVKTFVEAVAKNYPTLRMIVGSRPDGLPDLDWIEIPETDAQGRREFIYQQDERRTEPTFWIARYPVTYRQFQAFLDDDDGFANPVWWTGLAASADERAAPEEQFFKFWNHPRERVSWYDAMAFCRWLTVQAQAHPDLLPAALHGRRDWQITLPTEWQWEKAARGSDGRPYPWGDTYQAGYANINEASMKAGPNYLQKTSAVGMYPYGASPYGVLDMSGNVWERCLNEYDDPDRTQAEGDARRVVRGGSWGYDSAGASALNRYRWRLRDPYDGFRVVVGVVVPSNVPGTGDRQFRLRNLCPPVPGTFNCASPLCTRLPFSGFYGIPYPYI